MAPLSPYSSPRPEASILDLPVTEDEPRISPTKPQPTSEPDPIVVLQVGERRFHTFRATLTQGSPYFASRLSGEWPDAPSADGSYFVDADSDIFPTILAYLRQGVLPTFFDKGQRFDHNFCRAVRAQADFFGIEGLLEWIRDKRYLKTFTIEHTVEEQIAMTPVVEDPDPVRVLQSAAEANTEQTFHPSRGTQTVYECPRNIPVHDGHPEKCGRQCNNEKQEMEARGGSCYVERGVVRVMVVTKKTVFHDVEENG